MTTYRLFLTIFCAALCSPTHARPMLYGNYRCVVDATDPTSGFPLGFSICWSPAMKIKISRVDTLELLANPKTYRLDEHSGAIKRVLLSFRPQHDPVVMLAKGELFLLVDTLGDPVDVKRGIAAQMDLADRLQAQLKDFIAQSAGTEGTWRAFERNGQVGFEPSGGGKIVTSGPALNYELLDEMRRLYKEDDHDFTVKLRALSNEEAAGLLAMLDDRVKLNNPGITAPHPNTMNEETRDVLREVEWRVRNAAMEKLLEWLKHEPIPDGEGRWYCYSLQTGSFQWNPSAPPGFLDALEQEESTVPNQELRKMAGCSEGIYLTMVGGSLLTRIPSDLRDKADTP